MKIWVCFCYFFFSFFSNYFIQIFLTHHLYGHTGENVVYFYPYSNKIRYAKSYWLILISSSRLFFLSFLFSLFSGRSIPINLIKIFLSSIYRREIKCGNKFSLYYFIITLLLLLFIILLLFAGSRLWFFLEKWGINWGPP